MSYRDDPIEPVGGVKRDAPVGASAPTPASAPAAAGSNDTSGHSKYLYQSNYVFEVMKWTNVAMQHQSDIVAYRGEVAQLATKIAGDLATISQFISSVQSKAHSGGQVQAKTNLGNFVSPNSFSGLAYDYYHMDQNGNDDVSGCVSDAFKDSMAGFMAAVKELYFSSPIDLGPSAGATVKDLSTISNPFDSSKNFNMADYFSKIQGSFSKYSDGGFNVISTNPTDRPSLIQQYMYAKANLAVHSADKTTIDAANGDISQLVNFSYGSTGFDTDLAPFMQTLDSLDVTVSVANQSGVKGLTESTSSSTVLEMILKGQLYNGDPTGQLRQRVVGLYCAFSYMGYNYIWTKNPNMDVKDISASNVAQDSWWIQNGKFEDYQGSPQGDPLSVLSGNATTTQSNFSAAGSAANTNFQQDVNSVQQVDGAAGKIADGYAQAQETLIRNAKTG